MKKIVGLLLFVLLTGCARERPIANQWMYSIEGVGHWFWHSEVKLYTDGKAFHRWQNGYSGGNMRAYEAGIYSWSSGGGLRHFRGAPYPNEIRLEWVSYSDKERYAIKLKLPNDLKERLFDSKGCKIPLKERDFFLPPALGLGMAPRGYVEVYLYNTCENEQPIIAKGFAQPFENRYDKEVPLSKQFENRWADFDEKFEAVYKKRSLPKPEEWEALLHPEIKKIN